MDKNEIIKSIGGRTNGEIYLGVVGPVRTGKSTFIKKFIETLVLPNITDEYERKKCMDEIPQSAQGKTIMTTEPKFVPSNIAKIKVDDFETNIRLVDCVGYVIDGAKGYEDENGPRMVRTPWFDDEIPFIEAAEIGTEKVIRDHSTIGIVVTTDGSFGELKREYYVEKEEQVINELKEIGKPFIVLLNSSHPMLPETERLANSIKEKYDVPTIPISIENMTEKDSYSILKEALYEFPVVNIDVNMPEWIACLKHDHWLKKVYIEKIRESIVEVDKLRDIEKINEHFVSNEYIEKAYLSDVNASSGTVTINLVSKDNLYNQVLNEIIGVEIKSRADMITLFQDLKEAKYEYENIKGALKMVKQTGYGVAIPSIDELKLDNPEVLKRGNRYGIKLKAVAPSIHITTIKMQWLSLIDGLMREVESHLSLFMKWKVMLV